MPPGPTVPPPAITMAGAVTRALRRLSSLVDDPEVVAALSAIEDKVEELDTRMRDAENRLEAGGL